jgi:hypothetical protein
MMNAPLLGLLKSGANTQLCAARNAGISKGYASCQTVCLIFRDNIRDKV